MKRNRSVQDKSLLKSYSDQGRISLDVFSNLQDVTSSSLYVIAKKRSEAVEIKWTTSLGQWEASVKEHHDEQLKRRKDLEAKRITTAQEHKVQEDRVSLIFLTSFIFKVIASEANMKKIAASRDKLQYDYEQLKAENPKPEVSEEITKQLQTLENYAAKAGAQKSRLQMKVSEIEALIEEREQGSSLQNSFLIFCSI